MQGLSRFIYYFSHNEEVPLLSFLTVNCPTCIVTTRSASWTAESFHCLLFNSSALYYLQTPTRRYGHASMPLQFLPISGDRDVSLPLSLEWPVWSSSSGNNCHAVHRSLSSGASLWGGTFTLSHIISRAHLRDFFRLLTIGMCYFRYLRNGRCDRHRAEITIMQFIGHSLPLYHFFTAQWQFFLPCLILWAKLNFTEGMLSNGYNTRFYSCALVKN